MSYIIKATVSKHSEINNLACNFEDVDLGILHENSNEVEFCVPGDFFKTKEIVKNLCDTLIEAGIVEFSISHSY